MKSNIWTDGAGVEHASRGRGVPLSWVVTHLAFGDSMVQPVAKWEEQVWQPTVNCR